MRLLQPNHIGEFNLTEDFLEDDIIPPYAILSHTWGADDEEVTFDDLKNGTGKEKIGYEKIQFCGEQAARDGLNYFWIDTCCIDKSNSGELSFAIKSMFRWYHRATRCYVYLSDVRSPFPGTSIQTHPSPWESEYRKSKWFSRGWTLQELLAPNLVEFFSKNRRRLGDKHSLMQRIHEITGLPKSALSGTMHLSQFSVNERLSWIEHRKTKLEEDRAYSLQGIFDVFIPPIYGEGTARAFQRLMDEINKLKKCMQDLRLTDPRDDKKRIEDTKGGLLDDSYHWILEHSHFQQWRDGRESRLLWIKGDPGKGKTMLLCGIVNELVSSRAKSNISFFFCQATDSRINHAAAVLRGLLYLLVSQQPSLVSHIQKKHDHAGKTLFEDANSWVALSEIFTSILHDPNLNTTYVVVDALDECVEGLPKLLDFIVQKSSMSPRVKWVVSSRNWPFIEEQLDRAGQKVRLSLELNPESVSAAVSLFIQNRVTQLSERKRYDRKTKDSVLDYLTEHANNTFLWVALVCQNLENTPRRKTLTKLNEFPPGLTPLYQRMIQQIVGSEDEDDANLCKRILGTIVLVWRPITLEELTSLTELEDMAEDMESVTELVELCGSFLTIRQGSIYFVHQSAQDFLLTTAHAEIFPSGREDLHHAMFLRSLKAMSNALRRDVYNLGALDYAAQDVTPPVPDPLGAIHYSCMYWVRHLWLGNTPDSQLAMRGEDAVGDFLKGHFLHWLEALSLTKEMPYGVMITGTLETYIKRKEASRDLLELVQDASRFAMTHKFAMETSPLQVYVSALIFSPTRSLVRKHFKEEEPCWIKIVPEIEHNWSACLLTLEGHTDDTNSVAVSPDALFLASGSRDNTIKIWNTTAGECFNTFRGHSGWVQSVAISHNSEIVASGSYDRTVKIWSLATAKCLRTLEGHTGTIGSVVFSDTSTRLASASEDCKAKIWDTSTGDCLHTLDHTEPVFQVLFSPHSAQLASLSKYSVKLWNTSSGECLRSFEYDNKIHSALFSFNDAAQLVVFSSRSKMKFWDPSTGECMNTVDFITMMESPYHLVCSPDLSKVAFGTWNTIEIWDVGRREKLMTLKGHRSAIFDLTFSHDSTRLASVGADDTVKIWDLTGNGDTLQNINGHRHFVRCVNFSYDSSKLVSGSNDHLAKIWDVRTGECLNTLEGHAAHVESVEFSRNITMLATSSIDGTIKIWDASGHYLYTLRGHAGAVHGAIFSFDSTRLASSSTDHTIKIWDLSTRECIREFEHQIVPHLAFSWDSAWIASSSRGSETIMLWDLKNGECLHTFNTQTERASRITFSPDRTLLASSSSSNTISLWSTATARCLHTLELGAFVDCFLSFDKTGSSLQSKLGTIDISPILNSTTTEAMEPHKPHIKGLGISKDNSWITYDSMKLVWIPPEFRGYTYAISGSRIGVGVGTGRVWICEVEIDKLLDAQYGPLTHRPKSGN